MQDYVQSANFDAKLQDLGAFDPIEDFDQQELSFVDLPSSFDVSTQDFEENIA